MEPSTSRNLRLADWICFCNKPCQRSGGSQHYLATNADGVEPSDGEVEKSSFNLHFWFRLDVSLSKCLDI